MKIHIETTRLLMRDLMDEDVQGMFAMDSDAEVHTFLGKKPIKTLEEAQKYIDAIKRQYIENGISRWAVVEKGKRCWYWGERVQICYRRFWRKITRLRFGISLYKRILGQALCYRNCRSFLKSRVYKTGLQ